MYVSAFSMSAMRLKAFAAAQKRRFVYPLSPSLVHLGVEACTVVGNAFALLALRSMDAGLMAVLADCGLQSKVVDMPWAAAKRAVSLSQRIQVRAIKLAAVKRK